MFKGGECPGFNSLLVRSYDGGVIEVEAVELFETLELFQFFEIGDLVATQVESEEVLAPGQALEIALELVVGEFEHAE